MSGGLNFLRGWGGGGGGRFKAAAKGGDADFESFVKCGL